MTFLLDAFFFLLPAGLVLLAVDQGLWTLVPSLAICWVVARFWVLGIGGWGARPGEPGWGVTKLIKSENRKGERLATVWVCFLGVPWLPTRTWSVSNSAWTRFHWPALLHGFMLMAVALGGGLFVFWVSVPVTHSVAAAVNLGGLAAYLLARFLPWDLKAQR